MKYTDILIILILLFAYSLLFSQGSSIYSKLKEKNDYYFEQKNANHFISESFRNTCQGNGFESLCEWQKACKSMWDLKYIGWSKASEVMLISEEYKDSVFYGSWIINNTIGEVYWLEE